MALNGAEERVQEENLRRTLEPRKDAALFLAPARVGHRCCEGSLRCCLLSCPCPVPAFVLAMQLTKHQPFPGPCLLALWCLEPWLSG